MDLSRARSVSHLPVLDGLRAVAVLLVLWAHVDPALLPPWLHAARFAFDPGMQGVDLFFVLSGFLITRILLAEREQGLPVRWFMLRRVLRIFPIYYLLLLVMGLLLAAGVVHGQPDLPWCAAYLSNFWYFVHGGGGRLEHTWSLCVEEHFYLLWPPVVALLGRRAALRAVLFVALPLALVSATVVTTQVEPERLYRGLAYLSPVRFLSLGVGCLLAFGEPRLHAAPRRARALGLGLLALGVLATPQVLVRILLSAGGEALVRRELWPVPNLVSTLLVSTGLMLVCLTAGARSPLQALSAAPLRAIGRISYGLYLYHVPVFALMHAWPTAGGAWLSIGLAFAAAALSYLAIERPILRFARRLGPRAARAPVPALGEADPAVQARRGE